jgi:hypothetical protein
MGGASERQLAVLRAVEAAGGFLERLDDLEAAEECTERGWLVAEDHHGYGLTLDGRTVLRAAGS